MTMQATDYVFHEGTDFALAAADGVGLFNPADHGIPVRWLSSACWRGFLLRYAIVEGRLILRRARLGIDLPDELLDMEHPEFSIGNVAPKREPEGYGWWYENLNLSVPFTGGLLLGTNQLNEPHVSLGLHPAWRYHVVREVVFERGGVQLQKDASEAVHVIRTKLLSEDRLDIAHKRSENDKLIQLCFTRDYLGKGV
jgi:hypothetical protein